MIAHDTLRFVKAQAAGNDFIIFDNRDGKISPGWKGFVRWLCDRHYGIGADGVILVESSERADFRYRHLNSDGSPAGMCGNGSRCVLRFAHEGLALPAALRFEMDGVIYRGTVAPGRVTVEFPSLPRVDVAPLVAEAGLYPLGFLDVGVPHLVLLVDDVDRVDVAELGRRLRHHPAFPFGTNVDFVQVVGRAGLRVRTFERGVEGETLACGTGAVASAAATRSAGLVEAEVEVRFPGGTVEVRLCENKVELSGQAKLVFRGEIALPRAPWEMDDLDPVQV
ncbi:MAG: diaminopimelate epimerase [candidate division KSB1 bacterium]|nr:diaminopimelate epimerase [candidate division KSB1 bacterium]